MPKRKTKAAETTTVTTAKHSYVFPSKFVTDGSTVSSIVRAMAADGWQTAQIAKTSGMLYQHVRNVLTAPTPKTA